MYPKTDIQKRTWLSNRHLFILLILILSFISLLIGVKSLHLSDFSHSDFNTLVVSRIPRLISLIVVGASVSMSGLIMQTITNNRFVSPTTIGTTEWARLGILIAILFFGQSSVIVRMSIAFLFCFLGSLFFLKVLGKLKIKNEILIPLVGIMIGNVVNAFSTYFAYRYDLVQNMSSWLQGSFSLVIKGRYELLYLGIPFLLISYFFANQFTIAGMGQSFSKNLGLNHARITTLGLLIVSVITATVTVTIGSIPFLGLIIPNIIRITKGDHLKNTLLDTALLGILFVLICDILGRILIFPYEITIGLICSIVGSAIFIKLIFRRSPS